MDKPLPPLPAHYTVAIIGAGISGLACGQALADSGIRVTLFDKARGPGGRMSSKRMPSATLDLGAQAFSVSNDDFQREVDKWLASGCIAVWPTHTYQASSHGWEAHNDGQKRYSGAPRMSALTRHMADSLTALPNAELHSGALIVALERSSNGWRLIEADGGRHGPYDQIVISAPAPQAHSLVEPWDGALAATCLTRKQRACWAGWAIFDGPLPALPGVDPAWQMARITPPVPRPPLDPTLEPVLKLISRNQTKPGRDAQPESLSLLAQLDWSEAHLEHPADAVAEQLFNELKRVLPSSVVLPKRIEIGAHRWRYAQPSTRFERDYLYNASGLALCGDSFSDGRVEDAWLSGHRLGEILVGRSV